MSSDPKIRRLRPHHARGLGRRQGPDGCAERNPVTGARAAEHLLSFCPEAFEAS